MIKEGKNKKDDINSSKENSENIDLKLSLPEQYEDIVSDVQKEIMNEELDEFAPIKENDINIATTYVYEDKEEIEAKVYFRNGFTNKVNFEYVPLVMINSKGEILAKKIFDLKEMGDIPPCGARPWKISFPKSEVDMNKFSLEDCKIIFDAKIKAVKYAKIELETLDESMQELRSLFENFLKELPGIEHGNVSISKFNIALSKEGKIMVSLMVRNATDKTIKIDEMPVKLVSENNDIVASGIFNLNGFEVCSMKAKICIVAFQTELNFDQMVSIDNWKVLFQ